MSFVQTGFLIACAAMAIPVIVHLLSRWQVRQIELGTMRFLQEVIRDGAQRRKIRRWLLLLTRAAICALLAFLFARPFLPETIKRDGDRLRVILIDKSASMGMPGTSGRLIDDAVTAANESVAKLGEDAKIVTAWFDNNVEPTGDSQLNPRAPQVVTGDTDYLAAVSWARDQINGEPDAVADVVIITDLQQSGLSADSLATESLAFPKDVPVQVVDVGRPAANNLAITNVSAPTKRLEVQRDVVLRVTLFNYGDLPFEDVPLSAMAFDGTRTVRLKKSINIAGGQAEEIKFDFGTLEAGMWRITIGADVEDDLAADNRRMTAIEIAQPINILVIDSGSESDGVAAESYYLATALQQTDSGDQRYQQDELDQDELQQRFHADVIYLQDESLREIDTDRYPLVVVADAAILNAAEIGLLENYAREGGDLLVFAGDGDNVDSNQIDKNWSQSVLAPGAIQSPASAGAMPFRITSVATDHTMLRPFADPQHGDLSRLAFRRRLPVEVNEETQVLAEFDHNRPALTHHQVDRGSVVWFLASVDSTWGSWTKSPLYLPVIQQMVADLLNLTGEGTIRFRSVGDADSLIASQVVSVKTVAMTSAKEDQAMNQSQSFDQPGFDQRDDALYVINGTAKESDPTRMDKEVFVKHFGLMQADDDNAVVSASVVGSKRNELWPWLAAALFVLLIGEFCLANRTTA